MRLNWSKQVNISFHSLKQHKLRSILSMLGVIFGIISVVTMLSVGEGVKQKVLNQLEQLGTNNIIIKNLELTQAQEVYAQERLSNGLIDRDIERLRKNVPHLRDIAPMKEITASVLSQNEEFYPEILSTSGNYKIVYNIFLREGRFICDLDMQQRNFVCVLGSEIAENLGLDGMLGSTVRIENEMFKVVGILREREHSSPTNSTIAVRDFNRVIFIPLNTEGYLVNRDQIVEYSEIVANVIGKEYIFVVANAIKSLLDNSHQGVQDYQIIIPQELISKQKQIQTNFNIFLGAIAAYSGAKSHPIPVESTHRFRLKVPPDSV